MSLSIGRGEHRYPESNKPKKPRPLWQKVGCALIPVLAVALCISVWLFSGQMVEQAEALIRNDTMVEITVLPLESRLGDDVELIVLVKNNSNVPIEKTLIALKNINLALQDDVGSFIIRSPTPSSIGETPSPFLARTFVFPGTASQSQKEYKMRLVGRSVGEYNLNIEVAVDQYRDFMGGWPLLFDNITVGSKKVRIAILPK